MNPLCVVFDIDDTLYLEHDYVMSGFAAVGKWAQRTFGIPDLEERCCAAHLAGQRGNIFDSTLSACGVAASGERIEEVVGIYRSHVPNIRMCDDAATAVATMRNTYPIAIISDGPAISQAHKADALALSDFAAPICLTERLGDGCSKPSPVPYRFVMTQISARHYVYVADNPLKDFTAPQQLGWTSIRIRRPRGLHFARPNTIVQPDFELSDCAALPKIFAVLSEPRNTGIVA